MKNREELLQRLPVVTVIFFLSISAFLSIRAITNYLLLMIGQFRDSIPVFVLFGNPLKPSLFGMGLIVALSIATWLVSTKMKKFQSPKMRLLIFLQMFFGIVAYYTWYITAPVYNSVVPYLQERIAMVDVTNVWHGILIGNTQNLMILLVFVPGIVINLMMVWILGQYSQHNEMLKEKFFEFEFKSSHLQRFFKLSQEEQWPDIILGPDSETKEQIIQPGKDRTLNNIIIGSIGTGKTAALVLPILNQDLHWMTRFINKFPEEHKREDYETENIRGMYLNGVSVIEPSNDLCKKAYELVKAHNIPEESVFYIDPTDPNTPSINPMQGPVDQVAEAFAMVIEGLAEGGDGGNFFFQQSERNHLKHYIYLLKLHDPEKSVTFDMLLDMYNNSQLVRTMHVRLKDTFPAEIDSIEDRDERNHWKIVQQIDEWFDNNLLPKTNRQGVPEQITTGKYRGQPEYYDAKSEYVQGLRNILNDIGANKLIRRVLFGSSDFDFDKHLEYGGVLLVNTAKGELAGLSNVLGKLVLLSLQNAVFRRTPVTSSFHHILVDEFPDYIYRPFKEFGAQSRKYRTIISIVSQTVAQLADKYGETYMQTLIGSFRHKMVYGDVTEYDANLFSAIFGEEDRFEEMQSEQSVSPLQESPVMRTGSSYTKTREAILSPSDIIYQKEFQAAVKIVRNNRPIPVRQIDANFVPKEEFEVAKVTVDDERAAIWMAERNRMLSNSELVTSGIEEVENETEIIHPFEQEMAVSEPIQEIKEPNRIIVPAHKEPKGEVQYSKAKMTSEDSWLRTRNRNTPTESSEETLDPVTFNQGMDDVGVDIESEPATEYQTIPESLVDVNEDFIIDEGTVTDEQIKQTTPSSPKAIVSQISEKQNALLQNIEKELKTVPDKPTPTSVEKNESKDFANSLITFIDD